MKTLGIIGGIGPESTIEYYRFIIQEYRQRRPGAGYPAILINSIDLDKAVRLVEGEKLDELADYLLAELERLARAGTDIGLLAANTAHIVFDRLQPRSPIPLVSIVEAACERAKSMALKKIALLGTGFTMQAGFYPEVFARAGITLVVPSSEEQAYIHEKYMGELLKNVFLPETRQGLLGVIERLREQEGIEAALMAGTELPLLLRDAAVSVPLLDTTLIHVNATVTELLEG